jgi:elongation factor G
LKDFQPNQIRNLALASHHGTGKTSLAEAILFRTKASARHGKIEDGTTALDFSPEEVHRKISISLSLAPVEWRGHKINLIDTPGYADFIGDCVAGLRVADAAIFCLKGAAGVEAGTEMIWERVHERGCAVLCAVTQMEKEHARSPRPSQSARRRGMGTRFVAIAWPFGGRREVQGSRGSRSMKAFAFEKDGSAKRPSFHADVEADVKKARAALVDAAAEADDALSRSSGRRGIERRRNHKGLREGVLHRSFIPAVPVVAVPMLGIDFLLDVMVDVMPSPADLGAVVGTKPGTQEKVEFQPDPAGPLAALVFKTSSESHAGDLSFVRVFAGTLAPGKEVWNSSAQRAEKTGQLFTIRGKDRSDAGHIPAGDIGAAVKLRETHTGQTLCDKNHPILLPSISFPDASHEIAIAPKSKGEDEKMGTGFHKLREEDPTLHLRVDGELHQTILSCLGDLQVDVVLERLTRRFGVHVETLKPRIPYRETIRRSVSKQGRHKKQTGGRGQFGDVHVRLEPLKHGQGFEFVDEVVGGSVPRNYIPAVEKGIIERCTKGSWPDTRSSIARGALRRRTTRSIVRNGVL